MHTFPKLFFVISRGIFFKQKFLLSKNACNSKFHPISSAVIQGHVLGVTLFLIYINDTLDGLDIELSFFADDDATALGQECCLGIAVQKLRGRTKII
jgi:hypothetical protein